MRRPLTIFALIYSAGVIASDYIHLSLWALFATSFVLFGAALLLNKVRTYALWGLLFATGWTNATWQSAILSPHDLRAHFTDKPELVSIRGTLLENPQSKALEENTAETVSHSLARMETKTIQTKEGWKPSHGTVLINTLGPLSTEYRNGSEVEVAGILQPPPGPIAEGLFDYRKFLRRQEIYFQLTARDGSDWQRTTKEVLGPGFSDHFLSWGRRSLKQGLPEEEDEALHLLYAMTLGWKATLDAETSERFMQSGTMHIFAISGLHIALIAGMLIVLLRVLRVPRNWCAFLVIPLLWFYTGATGWQASAVRSSIMMTIVILGWSLKRPGDLLNSLGAAALIILLWEPQQLFQASFQLSFFVVLSIALMMPPFEKLRQRMLQTDPFLPPELRPRWQRWLDHPTRFITVSFITGLAAWLGSLPLGAYYFNLFNPVSLIANLVVVPLSSLALMSNLGSLLTIPVLPFLADLFNHAAWLFMKSMIWLSEKATELPAAFLNVRSPTLFEMIALYALIFSVCTGWIFTTKQKRWVIPGLGLISISWIYVFLGDAQTWKITVIPLGGGDSIVIDAPGRENDLLIDCGDARSSDYVVKPFLQAQGFNRLSNLILTHGDIRHTGGTTNIMTAFKVDHIFTSPVSFRSSPYRKLLVELDQTDNFRNAIAEGEIVAGWKVLYPKNGDKFSQADDGPMVLQRTIHGMEFLFLSDLARNGQTLLLERHPGLHADVVVSGLPRDGDALSDSFIESIKPKLIIITDAEFPATDRATPQLRERLAKCGVPVLFTRDCGAVTFELKPAQAAIRVMNENDANSPAIQSFRRTLQRN